MNDLSNVLKEEAVRLGLCSQWTNDWVETETPQSLIDKYKKGIDFAIKHDYPSIGFIKQHFDKDLLHRNHIYVDEKLELDNPSGVIVINGGCTGNIHLSGFSVCSIYVRHTSRVCITCRGMSKVFISMYDSANVEVEQRDVSKVYIYQRGENQPQITGDVYIRKNSSQKDT